MRARLLPGRRALLLPLLALAAIIAVAPDRLVRVPSGHAEGFLPPGWFRTSADDGWYWLGTDYLGRPFGPVLVRALCGSMRIALAGTAAVALGCLLVGTIHGTTGSRALEALIEAANLGVMAVPEAAVLVTLATTWPRTAPAWRVNASMIAVLVAFAVPAGARLIAERIRAVGRSGFVAASRSYGASPLHTFRHEVWPHLTEDLGWIVATVLPRFVAVEVGLAYLGVEYRDFEGLGRVLVKSFNNMGIGTAVFQMMVTIAAILALALLPQLAIGRTGRRDLGVAG